jgi:hypothetical protein
MEQGFVADTPEKIHFFRLLSLQGRLKLELATGLNFRLSAAQAVRKMFNLPPRCRKQKCLDVLTAEIERLQDLKDKERKAVLN